MQWIFGIAEHCDSLDSDHGLLENLHPFAGNFGPMVVVCRFAASDGGVPTATMASGARRASSAASSS
jgi:hypothetical protein